MKAVKELKIDVLKWRTGNYGKFSTGLGDTSLLNQDGYMCCLGFMCLQSGLQKTDIINESEPDCISIEESIPLLTKKGKEQFENTMFSRTAVRINDNERNNIVQKMKLLKAHFSKNNLKIKFINTKKKEFKEILKQQGCELSTI